MSNYNTGIYNEIVDHAEELYGFFSGEYMDGFENRLLDCGSEQIEIGPMQFVRVLKYRRTEDYRRDFRTIQTAMAACLDSCALSSASFGYFLVSKDGEFSICLATEGIPVDGVTRLLSGSVPDIAFQPGFLSFSDIKRLSASFGIISGDIQCNRPVADMLIQALAGVNGILGILAVPLKRAEVSSYTDALDALRQRTDTLLKNDMTCTSQIRKISQRDYRFVPELNSRLKAMSEYYSKPGGMFWKSCIWFSCEDRAMLASVCNAVAGAFNGASTGPDRARVFYTTDGPLRQGDLYLPAALFGDHSFDYEGVLRKPSLVSYVSTAHLSSLLQFPSSRVEGFSVIELAKTGQSLHLFDTTHRKLEDGIVLGTVCDSGSEYSISRNDLREHALVTGATGSGKTTTVFNLVKGVHSAGVPVLIIEPSKKDYWVLGSEIRDLKIFSFGQDAELLRINPLVPEEGVLIGNHIDSLLYAFSGAFEMEEPTRLALDGLLKYAYEQFGWRSGDIAFHSGKGFPRIGDLLQLLPEYCDAHLPYGEEVRSNVYGSLVNRLSSLNSGVTGEAMNAADSVTGKDLCTGTVLVELEELSLETKPFIAMLLMIKADQYLRQGDSVDRLKNVIVLEEAHNIFAEVPAGGREDSCSRASRYFGNMLSQIRGYGTGIIIADQGPSQINDTAVSNTRLKIIHSSASGSDMERIRFALNLTDQQQRMFPSLEAGEAIVAVRGSGTVNKVQVRNSSAAPVNNITCLFCRKRRGCPDFNQKGTVPAARQSLYAQRIVENRYNPQALTAEVHAVALFIGVEPEREFCLLGQLLSDRSISCGEREKRRIVQRYLQVCQEA